MKGILVLVLLIFFGACSADHSGHDHSPYAGEEKREIKALSEDDLKKYLNGEGMGYAKAAELNGFPGPKHILENETSLDLTAEQKESVQKSFEKMKAEAVSLGKSIVEKEKELDRLFSQGKVNDEKLKNTTSEIAKLQGDLRNTHLRAHLEMKQLLSDEQVTKYKKLRGYTN